MDQIQAKSIHMNVNRAQKWSILSRDFPLFLSHCALILQVVG